MNTLRQGTRSAFVSAHRSDEGKSGKGWPKALIVLCGLSLLLFCAGRGQPAYAQTFEWASSFGGPGSDSAAGIAVDNTGQIYITGRWEQDNGRFFHAIYAPDGTLGLYDIISVPGSDVRAQGIAVDSAGNLYETGSFSPEAGFPPYDLMSSAGGYDVFVVKHGPDLWADWAKSAGGGTDDAARSIAVDGSGNSYVAGLFYSDTATFGSLPSLTSEGGFDVFVAKYDSAGNEVWATSAGGSDTDSGNDIAVDGSGNIYVTGEFSGTATFGTRPPLTSAAYSDIFVAKYDSAGTVLWAESAGGDSHDYARGIAVDGVGNSYVTGKFYGTATFGTRPPLTSGPHSSMFVATYNSAGTVLWAKSAGDSGWSSGFGIAVDGFGNSYVTGRFEGTATFGSLAPLTSEGGQDVFVAKYDSAGNEVWATSAGGSGFDDSGNDIAVDGSGNIYVTGRIGSLMMDGTTATFGPHTLTIAGGTDAFVAKLTDVPTPPGCGDNVVNQPSEECDGTDDSACPGSCLPDCTCPGAVCSPDADGDGIQDGVDVFPSTYSSSFQDNTTVPPTNGGIQTRGDQILCVSDAPSPLGVYVESLSGGLNPATVFTTCPSEGMRTRSVYSGTRVELHCGSSVTAETLTGEVEVDLLRDAASAATLTLAAGNSVTFDGETLEVTAPGSNNTTLILVTGPGEQQTLPPGGSTTLPPPSAIPAVSTWGLVALTLLLLAGAKIYFARRRVARSL